MRVVNRCLMFLTRLGEHSKCIVTGDPSQIDLRPKNRSGLLEAIDLLEGIDGIAFTRFETVDVVRHPVVARIIEAYDQGRRGEAVSGRDGNFLEGAERNFHAGSVSTRGAKRHFESVSCIAARRPLSVILRSVCESMR
jgi:hypothetical protein